MENHIRDIKRIFVEERTKISFANKKKKYQIPGNPFPSLEFRENEK